MTAAAPQLLIGRVMHHRLSPVAHRFALPVFYVRLPLSEGLRCTNALFGWDRWRVLSLLSRDHGARDGQPLLTWIRARLRERGLPDDGEVVLQTFPRVFGIVFNPVSFWFCHDRRGALIAVLAEVNNTFGATHSYLLHHPDGSPLRPGETLSADKTFHVSPFFQVEGRYRFRFTTSPDGQTHAARIDLDGPDGQPRLKTSIAGQVRPWTVPELARAVLRQPLMTAGVLLHIHLHALRLWRKGVPFVGARPPAVRPATEPALPAALPIAQPCKDPAP